MWTRDGASTLQPPFARGFCVMKPSLHIASNRLIEETEALKKSLIYRYLNIRLLTPYHSSKV